MPRLLPCRRLLLLAVAACVLLPTPSAATRFMSWNTLNFPGPSGPSREDDFRAVIGAVGPDLLVCMEMQGLSGAQQFLDNVMNTVEPGQWTLATFTNSNDTERCLFYKASAFVEIAHGQLPTALRTIEWWQMRPVGYSSSAADLYVFVVHLKASSGGTNEAKRLAEVQILRNHLETLPAGSNVVVAGDFNIYDSGEPAWVELTGSQVDNSGQLFDPINQVGNWHNSASYADIHTQSTRTTSLGDGGATGGMDDRFDFVLANDDMLDDESLDLRELTYEAYGQDGLHFNLNVNDPPTNAAVGQALANNLQAASDHLPVVVDLQLPAVLQLAGNLALGDVLVGTPLQGSFTVSNPSPVTSDELDATVSSSSPFTASPTTLQVNAGAVATVDVFVDTGVEGSFDTSIAVNSDAADLSSQSLAASVHVVGASQPSFDPLLPVVSTDLDFGEHPVGQFATGAVVVHNASTSGQPAALQVYAAQISGPDASRFTVPSFAPVLVGPTPDQASVAVGFDDSGAVAGTTYSATLTLSTRDDPAVTGSLSRADLTVALSATIASTSTPAPDAPTRVTRLLPNVPNPFNPRTQLRYELAQTSRVRLEIFDLRGRRVRTLVDGLREGGEHAVLWRGLDDAGRSVASGSYLVRMSAGEGIFHQRVSLLR